MQCMRQGLDHWTTGPLIPLTEFVLTTCIHTQNQVACALQQSVLWYSEFHDKAGYEPQKMTQLWQTQPGTHTGSHWSVPDSSLSEITQISSTYPGFSGKIFPGQLWDLLKGMASYSKTGRKALGKSMTRTASLPTTRKFLQSPNSQRNINMLVVKSYMSKDSWSLL
jgi:hypothetical protein